ncbi:MerR family transcriptional regulator [Paenibacillus sp. 598K]|nr:MerR family transcriptional regulator [Paenibacillus sp. 598K]
MHMRQLCQKLGITKKAINYYIEQQLLDPQVSANGYREFSEADETQLRKISILRKLGLSIQEIRQQLADGSGALLDELARRRELERSREEARLTILRRLGESGDWSEAEVELQALDRQATLQDKLRQAFPGAFGDYVTMHFARYLPVTLETEEQREAYADILRFLDEAEGLELTDDDNSSSMPAAVSSDAKGAGDYDEAGKPALSYDQWRELSEEMERAVARAAEAPAAFWQEQKERLAALEAYRQSPAYLHSDAYRMQRFVAVLEQAGGYRERFIPAMKRLSPAYQAYAQHLEALNKARPTTLD